MKKIAVFPGSFDPFTIGHENIVKRALPMFDTIIIAIGNNSTKNCFFPLQKRITWIKKIFKNNPKIKVAIFDGLTVDFCKKVKATYILRGLRTSADFEFERAIANMNYSMNNQIETVFFLTTPELTAVNSTIVREIIRYGGDASKFVPKEVDLKK